MSMSQEPNKKKSYPENIHVNTYVITYFQEGILHKVGGGGWGGHRSSFKACPNTSRCDHNIQEIKTKKYTSREEFH